MMNLHSDDHVQLNTGPADQRQITALIAKNVEKKHNWMESQLHMIIILLSTYILDF